MQTIKKAYILNIYSFLLLCFISGLLSSCFKGVSILGHDLKGEKSVKVPGDKYAKELGKNLANVHDSVLNALSVVDTEKKEAWKFDYFMIGLGIEGKFGLAGIATFKAVPRIRLYFTKTNSH